ncbi:MAG: biotin/lipoyl-binding protein [Planctomycetes bacterium]|nr:biotin/lipoyl-binding protein [Planctomycetota bacterium]
MKRRTLVVLILLIGGSAAGITWQALKPKEPTKVLTAKAETVPLLRSIVSATGEIRAKEFVDIQAEVSGIITELLVREGDQVHKGDVLLRLDDLQLKAEVDAARAQVGSAEADAKNAEVGVATAIANVAAEETALANTRVELEQARITRDRSAASRQRKKELYDKDLIGSEEFEIADADARLTQARFLWSEARVKQGQASLDAVNSRVEAAKAMRDGSLRRIDSAQAALARASDMLGKTVLRAPLSGLLTKLNVEKGERAVPGIQSNPIATLMTIADMSVIEAEINVDEADIVNVKLGAVAEVVADALRDVKIAGTVTEIGQSPILASSSGSGQNQEGKDFKVVVRLQEPPAALRPGFTATADIVTATRENCLVIPMQALTAREVEVDAEKRYVPPPEPSGDVIPAPPTAAERQRLKELEGVFLLVDGRARFRPLVQGIQGDMDLEVLEGLQAGDEVVIGPYQELRKLEEWDRIAVDSKQDATALRLRRKAR